jgi:ABC-2 type transport system permease protein
MRDALAYEWMRIRTLRSTWWLTGLAFVLGCAISGLLSWALHHDISKHGLADLDSIDGIGAIVSTQLAATGHIPSIVCYLLAVLGIFAWGHEYRHGMVRASLTALNSRSALWWAKFLVVGAWVATAVAVTTLVSGVIGTLVLHHYVTVFTSTTWHVLAYQTLYAVLLTWLAMAFTAFTRSQAFALVTLFLWPLLIESLFYVFFQIIPGLRDNVGILRFLPFTAGRRMTQVLEHADSTFGDPLSHVGGTMIFGGTAVVLLVVSLLLFRRRDA